MRKLIIGTLFMVLQISIGSQTLLASPITIDIFSGSGGGYSYSGIHKTEKSQCSSNGLCMSGNRWIWGLQGQLSADLDTSGPYTLSNITGTLFSNKPGKKGTIAFSGGHLTDPGAGGNAKGYLDYTFTKLSNDGEIKKSESGTFYFVGSQMCCSNAINGGPNNLTPTGFTLWGNNWDITANDGLNSRRAVKMAGLTPLGIDLVGGNYTPTPEPTSMLLLGSGVAGLLYWRKKQVKVGE